MRSNFKPNFTNRPRHLKLDDYFYFFTIRTINGQWFLKPDGYKKILLEKILEKTNKYNCPLAAYAILHNHYHFIAKIREAKSISKLISEINGSSAKLINEADNVTNRKIWWNYYDHAIRNENDFFKHLNYIHQNPIKHKLTNSFDYPFSSYNQWLKKKGKEYLDDCFLKYPVIDFTIANDEF